MKSMKRLRVRPAERRNLPFLLSLWNDPRVMRYAGAKHGKGWNEQDIENWYQRYLKRAKPGEPEEIQLIVELLDGTPIGESGCGKVRKGWSCKGYAPPAGKLVGMTDVKLLPNYWGKGYGTEAMREVVKYLFTRTLLDIILVPPHKENVAAIRVYEKSGFRKTSGVYWFDHLIMETTRKDPLRKQKDDIETEN